MNKSNKYLSWVIWGCSVLFFFYEFFLRISPSVMVSELMQTFSVDAAVLGSLSAYYFYIYAPMQIPVGVLMDRYGARKLLTSAVFICGLGGVLFGISQQLWQAEGARIFMGFGSAFAFVAMIFIASHWLPHKYLPILIGIGNSFGMAGAMGGEGPLSVAVVNFGWRSTSIGFGIFGIVFAVIIYFLFLGVETPKKIKKHRAVSILHSFTNFKEVAKPFQNWNTALMATFIYLTTSAFAGLWCVTFLQQSHGFSKEEAGFATSMFYLGWVFGGPLIGMFSSKIEEKKWIIFGSALLGFCFLTPVIYIAPLNTAVVFSLLLLVGFFSGSQLLGFSYMIDNNPSNVRGSATAFTNFVIMLGGAIFQPFVGFLLDYTDWNYSIALSCFPLSFLLAAFLSLFMKEKAESA